jgi:NADH-quinone oxidoreductase subunit N
MFEVPSLSDLNIAATLPVTLLAFGACIFLLVDLFIPKERKYITAWLTAVGISVSLVLSLLMLTDVINWGEGKETFFGLFIADQFSHAVDVAALITALLGVMVAYNYLNKIERQRGEYYYLLLFTTIGVMFMGAAGDLVTVFVSLELLSNPKRAP